MSQHMGVVAVCVHQSIPIEEIELRTEYQAIAVRVHVPQNITMFALLVEKP